MKKILLATVVMFGFSAMAQEGAPSTPAPAAEASAPAPAPAPAKEKKVGHKKGKHKKDSKGAM